MTTVRIAFEEINDLPSDQFIKIFGNIVEHYSCLAIGILKNRPFRSVEDVWNAANNYLDQLSNSEKEKILKLHPDLTGKLNSVLTNESQSEQKAAGLCTITQEQKELLNDLNEKYKNKFGFPFVICARLNNVTTILTSIENRLGNSKEKELETGIDEVKKICKLRIDQIVL